MYARIKNRSICVDSRSALFTLFIPADAQKFSISWIVSLLNVVISKVFQKLVHSLALVPVVLLDAHKHPAEIVAIISVVKERYIPFHVE